MFERVLVPLLVAATFNTVKGKTRFQKVMFLIQRNAERKGKKDLDYTYAIYHHGPFSRELSSTINNLVRNCLLEEDIEETPSGYTMYAYSLTTKGKQLLRRAKKKKLLSPDIVQTVRGTIRQYGDLPLSQLVNEAYNQF